MQQKLFRAAIIINNF